MPSINLAPGTEYIIAARKRRQRLYAISFAIIALFVVVYGILFFMKQSLMRTNEALAGNLAIVNQQIDSAKNDVHRVELFERRLGQTQQLLDDHVKWARIYSDLERLLPVNTTLTSFDAGTDVSTVTVQGITPDIDVIAQTVASLSSKQSVFMNGSVKSVTRQDIKNGDQIGTSYIFTITLTINPTVWH